MKKYTIPKIRISHLQAAQVCCASPVDPETPVQLMVTMSMNDEISDVSGFTMMAQEDE